MRLVVSVISNVVQIAIGSESGDVVVMIINEITIVITMPADAVGQILRHAKPRKPRVDREVKMHRVYAYPM